MKHQLNTRKNVKHMNIIKIILVLSYNQNRVFQKKIDNDDISLSVCNKLIDRGFKKLQPVVTVFGHDVMLSQEFKLACKRVLRRKKLERILK